MTVRKMMTVIIVSKEAERIHQGLLMAANACSLGYKIQLFFTKYAVGALLEGGWESFVTSTGETADTMDKNLEEKGIASFDLLLKGLHSMNSDIAVCSHALQEQGLDPLNLINTPRPEIMSISSVIETGSGGEWITF